MKRLTGLLGSCLARGATLALALGAFAGFSARAEVYLNEFQSSNDETKIDENGYSSDWIELYNSGSAAVDLSGWGLSDKEKKPFKWTFPSGSSISAGGYLLVWCDGKDYVKNGNYHSSLSLSGDGETITLTKKGASSPSQKQTFGKIPCDKSWGRTSSGTYAYFATPTPKAANSGTTYTSLLAPVTFSVTRKLCTSAFDLKLSHSDSSVKIYYTTDCTWPTTSSSYFTGSGTIRISKTTIVRAMPYKSGALQYRNTTSHSYIFLADVPNASAPTGVPSTWYTSGNNAGNCTASYTVHKNGFDSSLFETALKAIPIVSISLPQADIFGSSGVYPNTSGDIEKVASFEWIHPSDASLTFGIDAGLNPNGAGGRSFGRTPKKSFRMHCKGKWGGSVDVPIFQSTGCKDTGFKHVIFRAEHNNAWPTFSDNPNENGLEYVKDQMLREMQISASGYGCPGSFVHLFLNGLYWGVYNTVERVDPDSAARQFDGIADDFGCFKLDLSAGDQSRGMASTAAATAIKNEWREYMMALYNGNGASYNGHGSDLTNKSNFEYARSMFDLDDLIDYMLIEDWSGNRDWPGNNSVCAGAPQAGIPWRWFCWDMENAFSGCPNGAATGNSGYISTAFQYDAWYPGVRYDPNSKRSPMAPFKQFMKAEEARVHMRDRIYQLFMKPGAPLSVTKQQEYYNTAYNRGKSFLYGEEVRWGYYGSDYKGKAATGLTQWRARSEKVSTDFIPHRLNYLIGRYQSDSRKWYPTDSWKTPELQASSDGTKVTLKTAAPSGGTVYYTTDGTDPREYWTGNIAGAAFPSGGVTSTKAGTVLARFRKSDGTWSYMTSCAIKASGGSTTDYEYLKSTTGKNWDNKSNWSLGKFPNAAGVKAIIGKPTEFSSKGWRNIEIKTNSVTVGTIEFTNGGCTNRITTADNVTDKTFTLNGGSSAAKLIDKDTAGVGMALLDFKTQLILGSDLELSVENTAGDAQYGGLAIMGELKANGKNITKTGAGKATLKCTNDTSTVVGNMTASAGTLSIEKTLKANNLTGAGTVQLAVQGTNQLAAVEDAVILSGALSVSGSVKLFVKSTKYEEAVFYGGALAKGGLTDASKCRVYVESLKGDKIFKGDTYKELTSGFTIEKFKITAGTYNGYYTYKVTIPVEAPDLATGSYNWKSAASGNWSDKANWTGVNGGTFPQSSDDAALFAITLNQDVEIDLGAKTYSIGAITNNNVKTLTLKNGGLNAYRFYHAGGEIVFQNMTLGPNTDVAAKFGAGSVSRIYPFGSEKAVSFVGNNTVKLPFHNIYDGTKLNIRDGVTTFNSAFSMTTGFTLNLENARFVGVGSALSAPIQFNLVLGSNNVSGGDAALAFSGALTIPSGSRLTVDATALGAGTYKLISAGTLTDSASLNTAPISVGANFTYSLAKTSTALTLTIAAKASDKTVVAIPSLSQTTAAYTGENLKPTLSASGVNFSYSADVWQNAATYTVTCQLADKTHCIWSDGTTNDKTLTFKITQAENYWAYPIGLTKTVWHVGEEAGQIINGDAEFGEKTVTMNGQSVTDQTLSSLGKGKYEVVFAVAETANWSSLTERIAVTVLGEGEQEEEDPVDPVLGKDYNRLEFIYAPGGAYFDTGIVGQPNMTITAKIKPTNVSTYSCVIGSSTSDANMRMYPICYANTGKWAPCPGNAYSTSESVSTANPVTIVAVANADGKSGTFSIDGRNIALTSGSVFAIPSAGNGFSMFVFARNTGGTAQLPYSGNLYSLEIKVAGVVRANYIPCQRKSDEVVGVYDTVSSGFIPSAKATAPFYAGPVIKPTPTEPTKIAVPIAATGLVYDGTPKTGVVSGTGYTVTDGTKTDAGSYTAKVSLNANYLWSNGASDQKSIAWSIAPAANDWTVSPSISKTEWTTSDAAGTLSAAKAKFGLTATIAKDGGAASAFSGTLPSAVGSYVISYTLATSSNWTNPATTTKTVAFTIKQGTTPPPPVSRLPDGYTELEYIASTDGGNQYFNTGIKGQRSMTVTAKIMPTKLTNYATIIGSSDGTSSVGNRFYPIYFSSGVWKPTLGQAYSSSKSVELNKAVSVVAVSSADGTSGTFTLDGTPVSLATGNAYPVGANGNGYDMYVFARNKGGIVDLHYVGAIYSLKIEVGGNTVAEYVPCKNRDQIVGMYDMVSGDFKKSANGAFVAGPEVTPPQPVEPTQVTPPTAATGLVYDGTPKTGVAAGTGYTVTDGTKTDAGSYTATAKLVNTTDYVWSDSTTDDKSIAWSIAAAVNEWTQNPSLTKTEWTTDETPATLTPARAKFGLTATIAKDGGAASAFSGTLPSAVGSYVITYSLANSNNWTNPNETVKTLSFTITQGVNPPQPPTPSGRLPDGFTEVEYVDTGMKGGAWFDSGIVSQYKLTTVIKLSLNQITAYQFPFGSINTKSGDKRCDGIYFQAGVPCLSGGCGMTGGDGAITANTVYTFETYNGDSGQHVNAYIKKNNVNIGNKGNSGSGSSVESSYTMYVGRRNEDGSPKTGELFCGRIYALQVWADGELIRDYVPCTNQDGVAGLYDLCEGSFNPSADTAYPFTAGEPVAPPVVEPTQVTPPTAATGLVYDGTPKTGVAAGTGYTVENNTQTDAGSYTATAKLVNTTEYVWSDSTTDDKSIAWSIAAAVNEWTQNPSLTKTEWTQGDAAGTLTAAQAKFGTVSATIAKDGGAASVFSGTLPTEVGSYTITYAAETSLNWSALTSQTISFTIKSATTPTDPTIPTRKLPEDFTQVEYVDTGVNGGAYIDTGIVGQYKVLTTIKFMPYNVNGYFWLVGSTADSQGNQRCDPAYIQYLQIKMGARFEYQGPANSIQANELYTIESYTGEKGVYDSVYLKLNSKDQTLTRVEGSPVEISDGGNGVTMFACARQGGKGRATDLFKGRLYQLQISVNGSLVRDYVPCTNKDGVAGLYDLCEGTFNPSADTAHPFTAGAPVTPSESPKGPTVGDDEEPVDPSEIFTKGNARSDRPIVYPSDGPEPTVQNRQIKYDSSTVDLPRYYDAEVKGHTIELKLNDHAVPTIAEDLQSGDKGIELTADGVVKVSFKPNEDASDAALYYALGASDTLMGPFNPITAWTNEGNVLTTSKPNTPSQFYKVLVRDTPNSK